MQRHMQALGMVTIRTLAQCLNLYNWLACYGHICLYSPLKLYKTILVPMSLSGTAIIHLLYMHHVISWYELMASSRDGVFGFLRGFKTYYSRYRHLNVR